MDGKQYEDSLKEAMARLSEAYKPERIMCRDKEQTEIKQFIQEGINGNGQSQSMYISGVPGLGKTASIVQVVAELQKENKEPFTFIYQNGLKLSEPKKIYQTLSRELLGQEYNPEKSCQALEFVFRNGVKAAQLQKGFRIESDCLKRLSRVKVLVIDELDFLYTQDQNVLYNIFEWPHQRNAQLVIIGIANTLDLPQRLMARISSRMGSRNLIFAPYNSQDIKTIIEQRVSVCASLFDRQAVQFISKKIAAVSSDIRKTLDICRRSLEELERRREQRADAVVTVDVVVRTFENAYQSPLNDYVRSCSRVAKVLLFSLFQEVRKTQKPVAVQAVTERMTTMASNLNMRILKYFEVKQLLRDMVQAGVFDLKDVQQGTRTEV
jgi:origin recognition complex subunit 1